MLIGRSRKSSASRRNSRFRNIALPGSIRVRTVRQTKLDMWCMEEGAATRRADENDTLEKADFKIVLAEVLHKAAEMPLEKRLHN